MISPAAAKRMPAKSILLPVMSVVMPKALKPTLISGKAQPQAMAAVMANTTTHAGRWNMETFFVIVSDSEVQNYEISGRNGIGDCCMLTFFMRQIRNNVWHYRLLSVLLHSQKR
jgi:hypothetical protein